MEWLFVNKTPWEEKLSHKHRIQLSHVYEEMSISNLKSNFVMTLNKNNE